MDISTVLELSNALMLYVIIFYKCQPKMLSAIMELSDEGEILPIVDIKVELNEE